MKNKILIFLLLLTGLSLGFMSCSSPEEVKPVILSTSTPVTFTISAQGVDTDHTNTFNAVVSYGVQALSNVTTITTIKAITLNVAKGQELFIKVTSDKPMKVTVQSGSTFESYQIVDGEVFKLKF